MARIAAKLYQRVDKSKFIEHPEYTQYACWSKRRWLLSAASSAVLGRLTSGQLSCQVAVKLRPYGCTAVLRHLWHNHCARLSGVLWPRAGYLHCHAQKACKLIGTITPCLPFVYPTRLARGTSYLDCIKITTAVYYIGNVRSTAAVVEEPVSWNKRDSPQLRLKKRYINTCYTLYTFSSCLHKVYKDMGQEGVYLFPTLAIKSKTSLFFCCWGVCGTLIIYLTRRLPETPDSLPRY